MKSSTKILIGVVVALSFLIGLFIGITIETNKTDKQDLAGTMGKFKNVDITENNANLREDLMSNEKMLKTYQQFFNFHASSCSKLCEDLDFAIQSAEDIPEFREDFSIEIENVKQYRQSLEIAGKDIAIAKTSLQQIAQSDEKNFSSVIKNANTAISNMNQKQDCIPTLVSSIEKFMSGNNPYKFSNLIKAHDLFAINQLVINP